MTSCWDVRRACIDRKSTSTHSRSWRTLGLRSLPITEVKVPELLQSNSIDPSEETQNSFVTIEKDFEGDVKKARIVFAPTSIEQRAAAEEGMSGVRKAPDQLRRGQAEPGQRGAGHRRIFCSLLCSREPGDVAKARHLHSGRQWLHVWREAAAAEGRHVNRPR